MYKTLEVFPNMKSFLKANREREINEVFRNGHSLQNINYDYNDGMSGFAGTKNYKEAESLALKGWVPSNARNNNIFKANARSNKVVRRTMTGPVGYAPHVPNAIAGRPDSMIYQKRIVEQQPSINILVNTAVGWNVSVEQIEAATLNIFSALQDTKINLCISFATQLYKSKKSREVIAKAGLFVKMADESMAQKFFAVAHPSMFRRLGLRWLEAVPGLKHKGFTKSHGKIGYFTQDELKELGLQNYKACNVQDFIGLNKEDILAKLKRL